MTDRLCFAVALVAIAACSKPSPWRRPPADAGVCPTPDANPDTLWTPDIVVPGLDVFDRLVLQVCGSADTLRVHESFADRRLWESMVLTERDFHCLSRWSEAVIVNIRLERTWWLLRQISEHSDQMFSVDPTSPVSIVQVNLTGAIQGNCTDVVNTMTVVLETLAPAYAYQVTQYLLRHLSKASATSTTTWPGWTVEYTHSKVETVQTGEAGAPETGEVVCWLDATRQNLGRDP